MLQNERLDPRRAVIYFDLVSEDYNVEEDAADRTAPAHALAKRLMRDQTGEQWMKLEELAYHETVQTIFWKFREMSNEGHSSDGALIVKIEISSCRDVRTAMRIIERRITGGDDEIGLVTPYFNLVSFTLFPQGVNGPQIPFVDWDEWLEDNCQ